MLIYLIFFTHYQILKIILLQIINYKKRANISISSLK